MTRSRTSSRGYRSSKASSSGDCSSQSDNASAKARSASSISCSVCDIQGCESSFRRLSNLTRHKLSIHDAKQSCSYMRCEYRTGRADKMRKHTRRKHQTEADTTSSLSSPQESIFDVSDCDSRSSIDTSMMFDDTSIPIDMGGSYYVGQGYVPIALNGVGQWADDSIYEDTCLVVPTGQEDYEFELDHLECYNVDPYIEDALRSFDTTFYRTGHGGMRSSL